MPPDLLTVRSPLVNFHVLRDASGLYLIDAGFIGARSRLRQALQDRGWAALPIRGIIVTHGHLDHTLNVAALAQDTGAWIAAPRLDSAHYAGRPHYSGWTRPLGWLEKIGRSLLRFRPFTPQRWLEDGAPIDIWHGLRAIHLPGHTPGHTGFYCERLRLLFCADLFASYRHWSHLPPAIFNFDPKNLIPSIKKALALDLEGIIPNHGDQASPSEHLARLRQLAAKM